jgi:hypothetical protein
MTFRCKESIYTSGCGQELEFYDPGNGAKKFVVEVGSNPLKKHVCPNAKPFQKSPRQQAITESRQITGTTTYPTPPNFTAEKNQAIQAMHDEKTELTKAYHKILERQNELKQTELALYAREVSSKEREVELLERQVKTQEWMSQTVQTEQDKKQDEIRK